MQVLNSDMVRLVSGEHSDPHRVLGVHEVTGLERAGTVIRAYHPEALSIVANILKQSQSKSSALVSEVSHTVPLASTVYDGLFEAFLEGVSLPLNYTLTFTFKDGHSFTRDDPYRFLPTVQDFDLYLFNEGTHQRLWEVLGAHPKVHEGVAGVAFAVWAPNALRVSVVGDFCFWDGRQFPMRSLGPSGVYELFIPGLAVDSLYKYEIKTKAGHLLLKADPLGLAMEKPPATASRVYQSNYQWQDTAWVQKRAITDWLREPMAIYEVHPGSWARVVEEDNRSLSYRELAVKLVEHVKRFNFNFIELMPIAEHPFAGSWGYQVSGYYAPTARFGTPDDFRFFVDHCHQHDIGVIIDWVPAHFPKDAFALARFDGSALYEHEDPRLGEHPDWGTLIFNYGRHEVRNFLLANALFWLDEYHVDGLRVDAVASMLYLDYSRPHNSWIPNIYGGRENLAAVEFFKLCNETVRQNYPGCLVIAEESTAWGGISRKVADGGLGFAFKWNMGWMHDTLEYFKKDPIHRQFHQDQLTFAMIYEHTENFIMPLSHDEVVHGKGSLLNKMPGDIWQKFANLRLLLTYQYTRPGKKLLFMGSEIAQEAEWQFASSIDWHLLADPKRQAYMLFLEELGTLYKQYPCLWKADPDYDSFSWIDCHDYQNSILVYLRRYAEEHLIVILNLTPVPREWYRIGAPSPGHYLECFSSDAKHFGGSDFVTLKQVSTEDIPMHGYSQSLSLHLPPLGALVLKPV